MCVLCVHTFGHVQLLSPQECRPPGSSIHGVVQARILAWFAIPPPGDSQPRDWTCSLLHWQEGSLPLSYLYSPLKWVLVGKYLATVYFLDYTLQKQKQPKNYGSVQLLTLVWLFGTPWTAAGLASLSFTSSQSLLRLMSMSLESMMPSNHFILCVSFASCLKSFSASGSFQTNRFFTSGGQSIGVSVSVSVLPMNIQDWFPLGWTGWLSLQFKGLSRVFSNTTVQKHQFFCAKLSL